MTKSDMEWTKEQLSAIIEKGENILVAAGAGSGKTAVLVERIIQKVIKEKISIDKLLVVTFTNAAASEMRERILEALYKKLDEFPEDDNIKNQIILLGKANICTIHSFCLDLIKNYFYEIDISPNFRIASSEENELYQQEVINDLFDELYESENKDFSLLIDTYATYRGDEKLKEIIIEIYNYIQSMPFPLKWLDEKIEMFNLGVGCDIAQTPWGKVVLTNIREIILYSIGSFKNLEEKTLLIPEMQKFLLTIQNDIRVLKDFYDVTFMNWDEVIEAYVNLNDKYQRWPVDKSCTLELKEEIKNKRTSIKNTLKKFLSKILILDSSQAINDIKTMHGVLLSLGRIIKEFDYRFNNLKKEKNILYFNDIEHCALKILTQINENDEVVPSDVAQYYQNKFIEIAIDEYQDSNQVQEFILTTISNKKNLFMVGDVKQSIYKFRQACPELFLEKYNRYSKEKNGLGLKIQLYKNFRSRNNVIDFTNIIFETIMSEKLGEINYNKEEFLNPEAIYPSDDESYSNIEKAKVEMMILDLAEEQIEDANEEEVIENGTEEIKDIKQFIVNKELEANVVAQKVRDLISSGIKIYDKKNKLYRSVQYKDIVILLRSTKDNAIYYEKELIKQNIPTYSDSNSEYIETYEIQTLLNVLKIIDNPKDDIALVSVLRSEIGNFSDNELTEIRLLDRENSFYQSLITASQVLENDLKPKVESFIQMLNEWKNKSLFMNISELIWDIYTKTGFITFVSLMPNGDIRKANLKKFFESAHAFEKSNFKGLFNFIRFFEKVQVSSGDLSAAKIISENENVVRIMSIHKSKGLEFPIVFIANAGKKTNLKDATKNILVHPSMGFGPEYIDSRKKIKYTTLPKIAINTLIKNETLSEEMRILYVALTRAREKLFIVASSNDFEKELNNKKELVKTFNISNKEKMNELLLKKYNSFKDWIEFVYLINRLDKLMDVKVVKKEDIIDLEERKTELKIFPFNENVDVDQISKIIEYNYPNELETTIPLKTSVSELKKVSGDNIFTNSSLDFKNNRPEFMIESKLYTAAEKGTLMHLALQKFDFQNEAYINICDNLEKLTEFVDEYIGKLVIKGFISLEQANLINRFNFIKFLQSDIAKQLQHARIIEKEKPFCTTVLLKNIMPIEDNDKFILVQGIIDLYYQTTEGDWVLLDYKTDYVPENDETYLAQKYHTQLKIYKKALEDFIGHKLSRVVIYSLYIGKSIEIDF